MAFMVNTNTATPKVRCTGTMEGLSAVNNIVRPDHQEVASNACYESSSESKEEIASRVRLTTPPRLRSRVASPVQIVTGLKYLEARRQRKAATTDAIKPADVNAQFRRFGSLPPELVLQVMKQASKSPGLRDMKALVLSSKITHGLWKTCKKGMSKYALRKYAEFEGYFGEMQGFLELGSENRLGLMTDMGSHWMKKEVKRTEKQTSWIWNAALKERHLRTGLEGPGLKHSFKRRVELISKGGTAFLNMLERLSKVVDADFAAFQTIPGSEKVEERLARKALLLLWTTRWRQLVSVSKEDTTWQDPCWETMTQENLVRDQPMEVRLALGQVLQIVLERTVNQLCMVEKSFDAVKEYRKKVTSGGFNTTEAHHPMSAAEMETWVGRQAFAILLHFTGERGIQDMVRVATSDAESKGQKWVQRMICIYIEAVWSRVAALESDEVELIEATDEWNFWIALQKDDSENVWSSVDPRFRCIRKA